MRKIRVVQYGTWRMCHSDHIMMTMRSMPQIFDVVGVCEPIAERREQAKRRGCYDGLRWMTEQEVLSDKTLDAVIIESHETEQGYDALKFAKAGFNLHVEKPGGADSVFDELADTAEKNGTLLHMGYMYRYNPAVKRAFELVESGKLGEINYVEAQMSTHYGKDGLDFLAGLPGGMMLYLGCHLTDIVYRIMGEPKRIIGHNFSTGSEGINAVDTGFVLYEYDRGISFVKTSASEINGDARRQLVISGTLGTVEIMPLENPLEAPGIVCPGDVPLKITYKDCFMGMRSFPVRSEFVRFPLYGRYDEMMIDFARKLCGEREETYTVDYERKLHRLITESIK